MFVVQNVLRHYMWDFYEPVLTPTKFTAAEQELQCVAGWHRKFLGIVLPSETLLAYNQDSGPLSQHGCLSSSFSPYNFSIKFKTKTWTFGSYFPTLQPPHHSLLSSKTFTHISSKRPIRSRPTQESIKPCFHEIQLSLTCSKILSLLRLLWRMFLR